MPALTPGARLHDRYLLEKRIGAGGMAHVWLAHDSVLGRQVAIKTLIGEATGDPAKRAGARREAQAAAKLTHPHITAVHDYGEHEDTPYIVMELLQGETLAERIARGPIPWAQAATIGAQIAGALAAAHAQGVVHQDVKPANIMLTPSGVKVLDFGIAAVTGQRHDADWIIGTPAYAPPERLTQAPPDPSADVFGLGAVLLEMVTGRKPWPIESWEDAQRLDRTPPAMPSSVPPEAAAAIREALDPSPKKRPSASALAQLLRGPNRTVLATAGGVIAASAAVPQPNAPQTRVYQPGRPVSKGRSPGLVAGVALLALILVIGGIFFITRALRPPTQPSGTALNGPPPGTAVTQGQVPRSPTPQAFRDTTAILVALRQTVQQGASAGQIEANKADDLIDKINDLARRNKGKEFANRIEDVRKLVDDLAEDGKLEPPLRQTLSGLLDQLEGQATLR